MSEFLADLDIPPLEAAAAESALARQGRLTKPPGSLGRLEELSVRLAAMTGEPGRPLRDRVVFTLAADHGVAVQGVSAYPPEVTAQMVLNFLAGGAAINVLARRFAARVVVADLGVAADLPAHPQLRARKIRRGSADLSKGPAMSVSEAVAAVAAGRELVAEECARGLDVACTGDMGIGNTTAAAALICHFTGQGPDVIVGRGTGIDDAGLGRKRAVVEQSLAVNRERCAEPLAALAALGGLEIAGLVGVMLECAARRRPVLVDGFIATAAAHAAAAIKPAVLDYLIAAHRSAEQGHRGALDSLGWDPLLDLGLRLGEGTGAVLALPLLDAAVAVLGEMATFEEAAVSGPAAHEHVVSRP